MRVAILYGSNTGKTEAVADRLQRWFPESDVLGVADTEPRALVPYNAVILGSSTWGTGDLQDDWKRRWDEFPAECVQGKVVAFFGLGDRQAFPDTFCNAVNRLHQKFGPTAARVVGHDLKLDDDNQGHLTDGLVDAWAQQLKQEGFGDR